MKFDSIDITFGFIISLLMGALAFIIFSLSAAEYGEVIGTELIQENKEYIVTDQYGKKEKKTLAIEEWIAYIKYGEEVFKIQSDNHKYYKGQKVTKEEFLNQGR